MKIQIKLNEKNPIEAKMIDYIRSFGDRSGVPKQLLLQALNNLDTPTPVPVKKALSAPTVRKDKPKNNKLTKVNINNIAG